MKAMRLLAIVFAFLAFFLFASSALADDEDFEVDYDIWPGAIGSMGGDVTVTLDITNTGPTDITSIDCVINTAAGFSDRWTGTIAPGRSRAMTFIVPFGELDVNRDRILQVAMNNNVTANPDGIKMFTFRVARLVHVINVSASVSPDKPAYRPGETVTITHNLTNNSRTHAVMDLQSSVGMTADGRGIYPGPWQNHGDVFPGAVVSPSFRYTFAEGDTGVVSVKCSLRFSFMGHDYTVTDESLSFSVEAPRPEFTAYLEAEPTEINPGDIVKFAVYYTNTGGYATDFAVSSSDGALVSSATGAPAGWEGHTGVNMSIEESCDVFYVVTGTIGVESVTVPTNTVHISVREPEPSVSSAPSVSASSAPASASVSAAPASSVPSEPPTPSASYEPPPAAAETASVSPEPVQTVSPAASVQAAAAPAADGSMLIYILIGAVVILTGAVAALFILLKKKTK